MDDLVIVIIAADGTISACGPFKSEYMATIFGNKVETEESGLLSHVVPLESPNDVAIQLSL
jgi:hypothetical protein